MIDHRTAPYAVLILRLGTGGMFLTHAALKFFVFTPAGTAKFFQSVGLPGPLGPLTILIETIVGFALILGVSFILFALINAIGNPIQILLAETPGVSEDMIAALSKFYGVDGNFIDRYLSWLWAVVRFDFGTSIVYNQPVGDLLWVYGLETFKIQLPAILLSTLIATAAGGAILEARGRVEERAVRARGRVGRAGPYVEQVLVQLAHQIELPPAPCTF